MSGDRQEIERIKREMRRDERMKEAARTIAAWLGSPEDRKIARAELEAEGWTATDPTPTPIAETPAPPPSLDLDYLPLGELERERRRLASAGQAHGYDALARVFGKKSRATIRRRYEGQDPPGVPIAGICESAPRHQHHSPDTLGSDTLSTPGIPGTP